MQLLFPQCMQFNKVIVEFTVFRIKTSNNPQQIIRIQLNLHTTTQMILLNICAVDEGIQICIIFLISWNSPSGIT